MEAQKDLIIVGAGPAGLAAACAARDCGLEVGVLDEQVAPGGQLFRNIETPLGQSMLESEECAQGIELVKLFRRSGAKYFPNTTVWGLESGKVSCRRESSCTIYKASSIIIAPGGMERPVPFPGWTLPGVLGAGAADIILRTGGTLTKDLKAPVVLAGNGPLLLLLACHLLDSGANIAAWLDTGYWSKRLFSVALMPASLLDSPYLKKGLKMARKIVNNKVPIVVGAKNIRVTGEGHIEKVIYEARGKQHEIASECFVRHEGIIPRTHILNSLNADHKWDKLQRYWYPKTDIYGATSVDGIHLVGDAGYVHGGDASQIKGSLAGIDVARRLGVIGKREALYRSRDLLKTLRTTRIARGFLRYVFAPNPSIFKMLDRTMVCRCEAVTAGDIRKVVREGNSNVNEVKLFTRCGMGQCQGRMCGPALAELTADELSCSPEPVGTLQVRQPFRPVSLQSYCELHSPEKV